CLGHLPPASEVVVAGGGSHHPVLMRELAAQLGERNVSLRRFDELFFVGDATEAVAFAMFGWLAVHGQPGNLPAVTGARGLRVLVGSRCVLCAGLQSGTIVPHCADGDVVGSTVLMGEFDQRLGDSMCC